MSEGFWRGDFDKPAGVLTLEVLQEAIERLSVMGPYPDVIHLMRRDKNGELTWCDACGPKSLYSNREWSILHHGAK